MYAVCMYYMCVYCVCTMYVCIMYYVCMYVHMHVCIRLPVQASVNIEYHSSEAIHVDF